MANTYAANFGDVVKHMVLCEALAGCGFLAAHLSPDTVAAATTAANDLARALADVRPGLRLE